MKPATVRRIAQAKNEIATVNKYLALGYPPVGHQGVKVQSAIRAAYEELGEGRVAFQTRVGNPDHPGSYALDFDLSPDWSLYKLPASQFAVQHAPSPSYVLGEAMTLRSRPDNTFLFLAAGDLHAGSKYTRWEVRQNLYDQALAAGAQCNFDTGNWIDGEATFNRYDIEAHGLDRQCALLAERHPKGLPTYAVWGDDHEGWYVQREGVDVGRYAESVMRSAGHEWLNLGFMEAHVVLKNANTGKTAALSVVHPGGGTAYALSYSIQRIIESYEGGEKPHVALYGHYHKLWAGLIRNVWVVQTGTQQDQTPFQRKKRIEAHVGGVLVKLRQDPVTGAILSMTPELIRYFNREYYIGTGRWSKHGDVKMLPRGEKEKQKKPKQPQKRQPKKRRARK